MLGPERLKLPAHDSCRLGPLAGEVIDHGVILKTVCPTLVATHPGANLSLPDAVFSRRRYTATRSIKVRHKRRPGFQEVTVSGARTGANALQAGRQMGKLDTVLMLVPMLPAFASAGKPAGRKVAFAAPIPRPRRLLARKDGDCHRACVNPPALLSRRHSLDTMAARLVARKAFDVVSFDYRPRLIRAETVLSSAAGEIAAVRSRQILREQFGVIAAFSGSNLDDHLRNHASTPTMNSARKE